VHLELPEDVAAEEAGDAPLVAGPCGGASGAVAGSHQARIRSDFGREVSAADVRRGRKPSSIGAGAFRFRSSRRIPFFNTQMGKGAVGGASDFYLGTAALSERDTSTRRSIAPISS